MYLSHDSPLYKSLRVQVCLSSIFWLVLSARAGTSRLGVWCWSLTVSVFQCFPNAQSHILVEAWRGEAQSLRYRSGQLRTTSGPSIGWSTSDREGHLSSPSCETTNRSCTLLAASYAFNRFHCSISIKPSLTIYHINSYYIWLICLNIIIWLYVLLLSTPILFHPFSVVGFWASFSLFATIVTLMPRCSRRMEMLALMRLWVLHFAEH